MPAQKKTEFTIRIPHSPGALADLMEPLAGSGVNILALIGYGEGDKAVIKLVPAAAAEAEDVLKGLGADFTTQEVVAVTAASGTGQGSMLARKAADAGVNMEHAYATTTGSGESMFILGTTDTEKAIQALNA